MVYKSLGWVLQIIGAIPFVLLGALFIANIPEATTGGSWGIDFDWKLLGIGFIIFLGGTILKERGNRLKDKSKETKRESGRKST